MIPVSPDSCHAYTWPEVVKLAEKRVFLMTYAGYPLSGRDTNHPEKRMFELYIGSCQTCHELGRYELPAKVREQFNVLGKQLQWNPDKKKEVVPVTEKLNAKGKPNSWSFSAIANFAPDLGGCPKKWAHDKFWCDAPPFVESEAIKEGNRVHKTFEDRMDQRIKRALPEDLASFEPMMAAFERAMADGGQIHTELEITVARDMGVVGWFDKKAWGRGKIDLVLIKGDECWIYDYKTGKVKDNPFQLESSVAFVHKMFPHLKKFTTKFIWTKFRKVTPEDPEACTFTDADVPRIWAKIFDYTTRMDKAWENEVFPANPSGLCPWCAMYDRCEYARRK